MEMYQGGVRKETLIVTCEHGGNAVPAAYAAFFARHMSLLGTHRGWDPGALELAEQMARRFDVPLHASTTTRLLIDLNRSIGHKDLYSVVTRDLPLATRRDIVLAYYRPHRDSVETEVANRVAAGQRVVHVASHSFTPELNGVQRQADIAWLYDPRRNGEKMLASRWLAAMKRRRPDLKLRRNYPYEGRDDGLTSLLRKRYPRELYIGIELEVNQRFVLEGGAAWDALRSDIIDALVDLREPVAV